MREAEDETAEPNAQHRSQIIEEEEKRERVDFIEETQMNLQTFVLFKIAKITNRYKFTNHS